MEACEVPSELKLRKGQQALNEAQLAEAKRFAAERIQAQLSTEPVNEQEAEDWLRQAYQVAQLPLPQRIHWLDSPLQFVAAMAPESERHRIVDTMWGSLWDRMWGSLWDRVLDSLQHSALDSLQHSVRDSVRRSGWDRVEWSLGSNVRESVREDSKMFTWEDRVADKWGGSSEDVSLEGGQSIGRASLRASVQAYNESSLLAIYRFFDTYLVHNDARSFAHFNEMVSGYWLGKEEAFIVRKPCILARDAQGRLHSATGKCVEYRDGWGLYAWHGVRVPEKVIVTPDALTRNDFVYTENLEVRRVIQERMGTRFVAELGGKLLDEGPRGRLYEVVLPGDAFEDEDAFEDDPERVARYVQVQDASTPRAYLLRVPPTITTAAEAVAWTFSLTVEDYQPLQET